jgi:uncharacterized cupin superfamily protein
MTDQLEHYTVEMGGLETTLAVAPGESASGVAVIEHTLAPGHLGAPSHRHTREDEISRVVSGELTVRQGTETTTAGPGETVVKNRDVWHTFWNAGDEPVRFVEVIAPGDFAGYFAEAAAVLPLDRAPDEETMARLNAIGTEYGLEFDYSSIPELTEEQGLRL